MTLENTDVSTWSRLYDVENNNWRFTDKDHPHELQGTVIYVSGEVYPELADALQQAQEYIDELLTNN